MAGCDNRFWFALGPVGPPFDPTHAVCCHRRNVPNPSTKLPRLHRRSSPSGQRPDAVPNQDSIAGPRSIPTAPATDSPSAHLPGLARTKPGFQRRRCRWLVEIDTCADALAALGFGGKTSLCRSASSCSLSSIRLRVHSRPSAITSASTSAKVGNDSSRVFFMVPLLELGCGSLLCEEPYTPIMGELSRCTPFLRPSTPMA